MKQKHRRFRGRRIGRFFSNIAPVFGDETLEQRNWPTLFKPLSTPGTVWSGCKREYTHGGRRSETS